MKLVLTTAPTVEPVSTADAKGHLRVDHSSDDTLIDAQVAAARRWAEAFTGRAFITQTYDLYFDAWPSFPIELPRPPLQSVTGVYYTDEDGNETEWSSTNYLVDTYGEPGKVHLKTTATAPSVTLQEANAVRVRFVAGYGDAASDVPDDIIAALKLLLGDLYENREHTVIGAGNSVVEVPFGVKALLWTKKFRTR